MTPNNSKNPLQLSDTLDVLLNFDENPQINHFIRTLLQSFGKDFTIGDFFQLRQRTLLSIQAIGKRKLHLFNELKEIILQNKDFTDKDSEKCRIIWPKKSILRDLQLNISQLDKYEMALFKKAIRVLKITKSDLSLEKLLYHFKPIGTSQGVSLLLIYDKLSIKINKALKKHLKGKSEIKKHSFVAGSLLRYCQPLSVSVSVLDQHLSDEISFFIQALNEQDKNIFLSRFQLDGQPFGTLDTIGQSFKPAITRERVRQLEFGILENLMLSLTYTADSVWLSLEDELIPDLNKLLPVLSSRFSNEDCFLTFLSIITKQDIKHIKEIIYPAYKTKDFFQLFVSEKAPIADVKLIDFIQKTYKYSKQQARNVLAQMVNCTQFTKTKKGNIPHFLSKTIAIAQAALFYPDGVAYKKLYQHINEYNLYGDKSLNLRQDHAIVEAVESGYIYQSDHGQYRHMKFIGLTDAKIAEALEIMKTQLLAAKNKGFNSIHLNSGVYLPAKVTMDYYIFRYIARNYGSRAGIYFKGKSGADTVSLQKKFNLQGQAVSIIRLFEGDHKDRSIEDIKLILRSKSSNHASDLVNKLQADFRLVRVGYSLYNIPSVAFANAPVDEITKHCEKYLEDVQCPVEINVLVNQCNSLFKLDFIKPWYVSLLKYQSHLLKKEWFFYLSYVSCKDFGKITIEKIIKKNLHKNLDKKGYIALVNKSIVAEDKQIKTVLSALLNENRKKTKNNRHQYELDL